MDSWQKEVNEQVEKLKYLENKREQNLQILQNRIQEIAKEREKKNNKAQ